MILFKKIFIFIIFFEFSFYILNSEIYAFNLKALSCSYSDVLHAYNSASPGDTVQIPPGTCIWYSTLNINKSINLIGAGSSATTIVWGGYTTNYALINVSLSNDVPIRISGVHFDLLTNKPGSYRHAIYIYGNGLTKVRLDNNKFTKGHGSVFINGRVWGVIDNNLFVNGSIPIYVNGEGNSAWDLPIVAGTANALFIEDNTFIVNDDSEEKDPDAIIYVQQGARTVIRYNTVDASQFTTGNFHMFNHHGNQNYYTGSGDFRGQPISEIYNNKVTFYKTYGGLNGFRGGSILFHNNEYTQLSGKPVALLSLREEECWQTVFFNPLRTNWPAQDQIINTFIWNNTFNGSLSSIIDFANSCEAAFIQENRDYFLHAPQASGGYSYYTGERKGGSTTYPTKNDIGSTAFSVNGANAYYPYTPYVYPHPLRESKRPEPPINLRIE
jgi:hypothetical protein